MNGFIDKKAKSNYAEGGTANGNERFIPVR